MSNERPASTAPHLDMEREIAELRAENAHLRAKLTQNDDANNATDPPALDHLPTLLAQHTHAIGY